MAGTPSTAIRRNPHHLTSPRFSCHPRPLHDHTAAGQGEARVIRRARAVRVPVLQVLGENRPIHYLHGQSEVHHGKEPAILDAQGNRAPVQHRLRIDIDSHSFVGQEGRWQQRLLIQLATLLQTDEFADRCCPYCITP